MEVRYVHLCLIAPKLSVPWTEPFEDEIHPRLRYAHRGIVGMANNGDKDSNDSQFFITLGMFTTNIFTGLQLRGNDDADRADELHGKHTLFGRCMGDTVYSTSTSSCIL
jgi:peptidyl-prolyl cis-trans isomerase SDCCAG10